MESTLKMLMMAGAGGKGSGANVVNGTFTVPEDAASPYIFNIGKKLDKYIFFIEATDESKELLLDTSLAGRRAYSFVGNYPKTNINDTDNSVDTFVYTYVPSTGVLSNATATVTLSDESISMPCIALTANNQGAVIKGFSYNYFIVEVA